MIRIFIIVNIRNVGPFLTHEMYFYLIATLILTLFELFIFYWKLIIRGHLITHVEITLIFIENTG